MIEFWCGNVNVWECDELGYMNVQFYLVKVSEVVGNFVVFVGLENVFCFDNYVILLVCFLYIKFFVEVYLGVLLVIVGGIIGYNEIQMQVELIMCYGGLGCVVVIFCLVLDYVLLREGWIFKWLECFYCVVEMLICVVDFVVVLCGVVEDECFCDIFQVCVDVLGLEQIGMGCFIGQDIGFFDCICVDVFFGWVFNSVVNFVGVFFEEVVFYKGELDSCIGSVLLEICIFLRCWLCEGDGYVICFGFKLVGLKVCNLVYWVLDLVIGKFWWIMEGVVVFMDFDVCKLVELNVYFRVLLDVVVVEGIIVQCLFLCVIFFIFVKNKWGSFWEG